MSEKNSDVATVYVDFISKSVTSAFIVTVSVTLSFILLRSISTSSPRSRLSRSRLSERPGIPYAITILFSPSDTTLPLSIVKFLKLSTGSIIPVTITNGV